jgi:hypothetical protein
MSDFTIENLEAYREVNARFAATIARFIDNTIAPGDDETILEIIEYALPEDSILYPDAATVIVESDDTITAHGTALEIAETV